MPGRNAGRLYLLSLGKGCCGLDLAIFKLLPYPLMPYLEEEYQNRPG